MLYDTSVLMKCQSLSARRAWIEIRNAGILSVWALSLSARRAWIEMSICTTLRCLPVSLSARRAWIEIFVSFYVIRPAIVALRKESVDRNIPALGRVLFSITSLSARRAWIEIFIELSSWGAGGGRSPQGERG